MTADALGHGPLDSYFKGEKIDLEDDGRLRQICDGAIADVFLSLSEEHVSGGRSNIMF